MSGGGVGHTMRGRRWGRAQHPQTVPDLVMVKVRTDGKVDLFNALGSTHVVADVVW